MSGYIDIEMKSRSGGMKSCDRGRRKGSGLYLPIPQAYHRTPVINSRLLFGKALSK